VEDVTRLYRTPENHDADFDGAVGEAAAVAEAWDTWREQVAYPGRFVAEHPDLGYVGPQGDVLRAVLVHLVEEYARHNGHADFLSERIDCRVASSSFCREVGIDDEPEVRDRIAGA
jgi:hypothetical protein